MRTNLVRALGAALVITSMPAFASWAPGASAAAITGTKAIPAVEDCGMPPASIKPKSLILACADAGALGTALKWEHWGSAQASATGTYTWNLCVPYCAASKKWGKARASFTLESPAHTGKGWLFEKLVVRFVGKPPKGMTVELVYSERPLH